MKQLISWHTLLILSLIGGAMIWRMTPHTPNIAPVAAAALLAGAYLSRAWAVLLPVIIMAASDSVIGFYDWRIMVAVYASFVLTVGIGMWLREKRTARGIVMASVAGSILFYLVTNAAVWKFSGMYQPTLDGLLLSYNLALPFFRNTLFGDLAFSAGLFATVEGISMASAQQHVPRKQKASLEGVAAQNLK